MSCRTSGYPLLRCEIPMILLSKVSIFIAGSSSLSLTIILDELNGKNKTTREEKTNIANHEENNRLDIEGESVEEKIVMYMIMCVAQVITNCSTRERS